MLTEPDRASRRQKLAIEVVKGSELEGALVDMATERQATPACHPGRSSHGWPLSPRPQVKRVRLLLQEESCFTSNCNCHFFIEKTTSSSKLVVDFPREKDTFRKKHGNRPGFRGKKSQQQQQQQQQRQTVEIVEEFSKKSSKSSHVFMFSCFFLLSICSYFLLIYFFEKLCYFFFSICFCCFIVPSFFIFFSFFFSRPSRRQNGKKIVEKFFL